MKITEVLKKSDKALFESIDASNDTGIATADLVQVVRANEDNIWSEPMNLEQFIASQNKLLQCGIAKKLGNQTFNQ